MNAYFSWGKRGGKQKHLQHIAEMLNGCIKIITLQAKVRTVYLKPHTLGEKGIQPHNLLRNPRKERDVNSHLCILGHYEILIMWDKNGSHSFKQERSNGHNFSCKK